MKVVMLKTGDVKEVAEGYARNYLIPHKLAIPATTGALRLAEEQKKSQAEQEVKLRADDEAMHGKLKDLTINITAKANAEGGLFAALGAKDICAAILAEQQLNLKEEDIKLPENIKKLGNFSAEVATKFGRRSKINLIISAQKE